MWLCAVYCIGTSADPRIPSTEHRAPSTIILDMPMLMCIRSSERTVSTICISLDVNFQASKLPIHQSADTDSALTLILALIPCSITSHHSTLNRGLPCVCVCGVLHRDISKIQEYRVPSTEHRVLMCIRSSERTVSVSVSRYM